jgi:very-short-patch-repair endonuclease
VRRPKRGVYATEDCHPGFLAAIVSNAVLTCVSAADAYGLWVRNRSARPHLASNHGHAREWAARGGTRAVHHRGLRFPPHESLPIGSLADTVIHALTCLPAAESVPIATSALARGLGAEEIERELRARKLAPALRTFRLVDTRVESQPEAEALLILVRLAQRLGVEVVPQAIIPGLGRVDFLIAGYLIVEIDGVAFHSDRDSVRRDRARDNMATLLGYARLRYVPEIVWREPLRFEAEVEAVLTGRRPSRRA